MTHTKILAKNVVKNGQIDGLLTRESCRFGGDEKYEFLTTRKNKRPKLVKPTGFDQFLMTRWPARFCVYKLEEVSTVYNECRRGPMKLWRLFSSAIHYPLKTNNIMVTLFTVQALRVFVSVVYIGWSGFSFFVYYMRWNDGTPHELSCTCYSFIIFSFSIWKERLLLDWIGNQPTRCRFMPWSEAVVQVGYGVTVYHRPHWESGKAIAFS